MSRTRSSSGRCGRLTVGREEGGRAELAGDGGVLLNKEIREVELGGRGQL